MMHSALHERTETSNRLASRQLGSARHVTGNAPGFSQLLRVQLAETLHPGQTAEYRDILVDRSVAKTANPIDRLKLRPVAYPTPIVTDLNGCNFGGEGAWLTCRWRSDLGIIQPVGDHGLTQRGVVRDGTILTSSSTGQFRISRRKADETWDESIVVTVALDFGRLPPVLPNGTEVILQYIPDHWTDNGLATDTGEWIVVNVIGISAIVGKLNASGATAMTTETGCAGKGTVDLYELNPVDECLDSLGVSTEVYNMCAALSGSQWVQAKDIGGNYWFDVVCCP